MYCSNRNSTVFCIHAYDAVVCFQNTYGAFLTFDYFLKYEQDFFSFRLLAIESKLEKIALAKREVPLRRFKIGSKRSTYAFESNVIAMI